MRNFFISLVLLFGVSLFTPQIASGNSVIKPKALYNFIHDSKIVEKPADSKLIPRDLSEDEKWQVKELELSCISEKKAQLPKEYAGPNLKFINVPIGAFDYHTINTILAIKVTANGERILTPVEKGYALCAPTKNMYYIDIQKRNGVATVEKESLACNCKEYLKIVDSGELFYIYQALNYDINNFDRSSGYYGYDVTDIPAGSYLRLIPGTFDVQVLPDTEETHKEIQERQREQQEIINKRKEAEERQKIEMIEKAKEIEKNQKKEKIKNIIAIVLTVLGFIIIIGIIAKNIFKKFKRK